MLSHVAPRRRTVPVLVLLTLVAALLAVPAPTWGADEVESEEPTSFTQIENGELSSKRFAVFIIVDGYICSGTVVRRRWVLTAAHCLDNRRASETTVYIGWDVVPPSDNESRGNGITRGASHTFTAPAKDVGLIRFDRPVAASIVVPLAQRKHSRSWGAGSSVEVYSWGSYSDNPWQPWRPPSWDGRQRHGNYEVADRFFSGTRQGYSGPWTRISAQGDERICKGDSGAGVIAHTRNGRRLVGVVANVDDIGGTECSEVNDGFASIVADTRNDRTSSYEWLQRTMRNN